MKNKSLDITTFTSYKNRIVKMLLTSKLKIIIKLYRPFALRNVLFSLLMFREAASNGNFANKHFKAGENFDKRNTSVG